MLLESYLAFKRHVQLIIALGESNQDMAYRLRRHFVWKLGPTGTCANKVLEDDDSEILRQSLPVTLTFLITGSQCRANSSVLCVTGESRRLDRH